jgi:hypothetical protein
VLDSDKPYLQEPWNAGVTNASMIYREITEQGYEQPRHLGESGGDGTGSRADTNRRYRLHPSVVSQRSQGSRRISGVWRSASEGLGAPVLAFWHRWWCIGRSVSDGLAAGSPPFVV